MVRLHPDVKLPVYATGGVAGMNLYLCEGVVLPAQTIVSIPTGLCMQFPAGTYGRLTLRSSVASKGIVLHGGTIDNDYTGQIWIKVQNIGTDDHKYPKGDRFAQIIVDNITSVRPKVVEALDETARGVGGFGSTGTQELPNISGPRKSTVYRSYLPENGVSHSQGATQAKSSSSCDGVGQRQGEAPSAVPLASHVFKVGATMTQRKAWGYPSATSVLLARRQGVALTMTSRGHSIATM